MAHQLEERIDADFRLHSLRAGMSKLITLGLITRRLVGRGFNPDIRPSKIAVGFSP